MKHYFSIYNLFVLFIFSMLIFSCKKTIVINSPIDDTKAHECEGNFFSKLNFDEKPAFEIVELNDGTFILNNTDFLTKIDSTGKIISQIYLDYPVEFLDKMKDGNLLICMDNQTSSGEYKIEKIDTAYNLIWSFVSDFNFILPTNDNGCIVGYEKINGEKSTITKYSENGNKVWDFNLDLVINDIVETDGYEYILGGYEYKNATYNPCLLQVDSTGVIKWKKLYTDLFEDVFEITNIIQLSSGNIVCLIDAERGYTSLNFFGTDLYGEVLWDKTLSDESEYNDIVLNGSQFIIATKEFFEESRFDIVLTNYNANSGVVWQNNYGGDGYEELNDIKICNDNSVIISASSTNFSYTETETNISESMYIIKADNNGNTCY